MLAVGGVVTLSLGSAVAVNAAAHSTGANACETQSGLLSLRHHGRCAAHTHSVTLGARGPQGAAGPRGAAGARGAGGLSGAGPDYQATSEDSFDLPASLGTMTLVPYTMVGTATGPGTLHLKCAANAGSGANPSDPYEVDGQANAQLLTAIHPAESLGK